jgi:hypothetical protein
MDRRTVLLNLLPLNRVKPSSGADIVANCQLPVLRSASAQSHTGLDLDKIVRLCGGHLAQRDRSKIDNLQAGRVKNDKEPAAAASKK